MPRKALSSRSLDALFAPRSIALVGVSDKPGSYGKALDSMCSGGGFAGRILRVNPRLARLAPPEANVSASLSDLPEAPDHAVLSLASERVEAAVGEALEAGARALTVFSQCPDPAMRGRIGRMAREAGAALCGPNSMGVHNVALGLRVTPFPAPLGLKPGGIGLISQSGSILGALMNNDSRLRFSQAVSAGAETATTASDYLLWMARRPETKCIGLFLEAIRDPDGFAAAMKEASRRGVAVAIMKVGRSPLGARMALSHTGALVGDDQAFRALAERLGGHMAGSLDEMAAMLGLFSQGRRAKASGIASIHDSGGERELMADMAEDYGLRYAELSASTKRRLARALEEGIEPANPLDAWGSGRGAERSYLEAADAMMADANVGIGLYVLNWRGDYYLHEMHERALGAAFERTEKPLAAVSNFSGSDDSALAERLADRGIPLLSGMQNAMAAARALLRRSRETDFPPEGFRAAQAAHPAASRWRSALAGREWIGEAEAYALLSDFGVACPRHGLASSRKQAAGIARAIGGAVALKSARRGLAHKSDAGGVRTQLASPGEVASAYDGIAARLGPEVLVAAMAPEGAQWSLGALDDGDFGPAVRISPGGELVELLPESRLLPAPFSPREAMEAIGEMRAARLLEGYRGAKPLACDSLAEMASSLSRLAWEMRGVLAEIEINPAIVGEKRTLAVDAVIRAHPASAARRVRGDEPLEPRRPRERDSARRAS